MNKNLNFGFSMIEVLVTVAVLGVMASISVSLVGNVNQSASDEKLRADVGTLNRAVKIYISNGGSVAGAETPEEVLAKLRTVADESMAFRLPGLSSSLIDPRVAAKMQTHEEAAGDALRAFWDSPSQGFKLANSGIKGIKEFVLDENQLNLSAASETREATMLFASSDGWVWDYQDRQRMGRPGPTTVATNSVPSGLPSGDPEIPSSVDPRAALRSPQFSIPGGAYPFSEFELGVELINPNLAGTSDLYYGIDGGPLTLYVGTIQVPPGAVIDAKAVTKVPSYSDSAKVSQRYSAEPLALLPPVITPDQEGFGLFSHSAVLITLSEANDPGTAAIHYRIDGGEWITYGTPFTLQGADFQGGVVIEAQTISAESPYYLPSEIVSRDLGSANVAFSGAADGGYSNPKGEARMVTNLPPGTSSSNFNWGNATGDGHTQSRLSFFGGAFSGVTSGERFKMGEMTYDNGTIQSGTGAESVDLGLKLNLDISGNAFNPEFKFVFELVNTPNAGNDPWAAADFVRIGTPRASETLVVDGYVFEFRLEFGETTADGFADFDEFHVLEDSDARVNVYGTFVNVGPAPATAP